MDAAPAATSDDLSDALDYRALKNRILSLVSSSEFHLLEALADAVAQEALREAKCTAVTVTVDKPGALTGARSVGVEVRRDRM